VDLADAGDLAVAGGEVLSDAQRPERCTSRSYRSMASLPSLIAASRSTLVTMDPKLFSAAAKDSAVG
jgi:hypothetical protein